MNDAKESTKTPEQTETLRDQAMRELAESLRPLEDEIDANRRFNKRMAELGLAASAPVAARQR